MTVLYVIAGIYLACVIGVNIFFAMEGKEKVVVNVKERTPFTVEQRTKDSITFSTKVEFRNDGKQCATIMDAIVRPQLPYEQYDGIEVRGKAEREGAPREDDYFEAVLIERKGKGKTKEGKDRDRIYIFAKVTLTPRKGMSLEEALSHMVDLPMDLIYMEVGRMPWRYSKVRIVLPAEEIAQLAGVTLVDE